MRIEATSAVVVATAVKKKLTLALLGRSKDSFAVKLLHIAVTQWENRESLPTCFPS